MLALARDLRYAADDAKLGVPFTALGMHPGMATTWLLPRWSSAARDLLLTGRTVTGDEAVALGLVNAAVPRTDVLDHATEVRPLHRWQRPHRHPPDQGGAGQRRCMPRTTPRCSGKHWPSR